MAGFHIDHPTIAMIIREGIQFLGQKRRTDGYAVAASQGYFRGESSHPQDIFKHGCPPSACFLNDSRRNPAD